MGCGGQGDETDHTLSTEANDVQTTQLKRPRAVFFDPLSGAIEDSHPALRLDFSNCIFCQACARACSDYYAQNVIVRAPAGKPPFVGRDGAYIKLGVTECIGCAQCVLSCPNGCISLDCAVYSLSACKGPKYAIVAPSTQTRFRDFDLVEFLQKSGFSRVFSSAIGADMAVQSEARAVIAARKAGGFLVSSACPAFVEFVERKHPWLLNKLSYRKSPAQLMAVAVKGYVCRLDYVSSATVVSFSPCAAYKAEIRRKDFSGGFDCVISDQELQQMLSATKARQSAPKNSFSPPFDYYTRSSYAHELPGAFSEALARQIFAMYGDDFDMSKISVQIRQKWEDNDETIKLITFQTGSQQFVFGAASGGVAVYRALEMLQRGEMKLDYLEAFMCPLGCVNGGGSVIDFRFAEVCKRVDELKNAQREVHQESPAECYGVCEFLKRSQDLEWQKHRSFISWYY